MDSLQPKNLHCSNCGAKLAATPNDKGEVVCEFCKTPFQVSAPRPAPQAAAPAAAAGGLILAADFRDPKLPGWTRDEETTRIEGSPPELICSYEESDEVEAHFPLESDGQFDDLDASVTIRWIDYPNDEEYVAYAGLTFRSSEDGYYYASIGSDGTYSVYWNDGEDSGALIEPTAHPQIQEDQPVRLRVVVEGHRFKVYLNGVLATTARDDGEDAFETGVAGLCVECGDTDTEVAFSDLQIRELPGR